MRALPPARTWHRSSLLHVPLLEQMLSDPNVRVVRRAVDTRWHYAEEMRVNLFGFNPLSDAVYYGTHSRFDEWFQAGPEKDPRAYNSGERLVSEVMFAVHDYLHVWTYQWLRHLVPELQLGSAPLTKRNVEDHVFCHLLSEAVATVGLDYWFLSTEDVDVRLEMGTSFRALTVSYFLNDEPEYRRFAPRFTAQRASFLPELARFYCDGEFLKFGRRDLERSAKLHSWLSHELEYGVKQREYIRRWFAYLCRDGSVRYTDAELRGGVRCDKRWQQRVMGEVAELLWDKVKNNRPNHAPPSAQDGKPWTAPLEKPCDFRFLNWNVLERTLTKKVDLNLGDSENFKYWSYQFFGRFDFAALEPKLLEFKMDLVTKQRRDLCEYLFRNERRLPRRSGEPLDLFLLP